MKKVRFFFTVIAAVALMCLITSCGKTGKKILGDWEVTSCVATSASVLDFEPEFLGSVWTFKDDNTMTITQDGESISGTYTIVDDDDLVMNFTITDDEPAKVVLDMDIEDISKGEMTLDGDATMTIVEMPLSDKIELNIVLKKK